MRQLTRLAGVVAVVAAFAVTGQTPPDPQPGPQPGPAPAPGAVERSAPSRTRHAIVNLHGSKAPSRLGFDVFDTAPARWALRRLPRGVKALVWMGQKCPTRADRSFRTTVRKLAHRRKVFGYYLSDEPHVSDCPHGPAALRSRADFIRRVSHGRQRSFVVLSEERDFHAFRTARTHVSLVGIDPYPCSVSHPHCYLRKINRRVRHARRRGIPLHRIVPVYQAFGQSDTDAHYYTIPSPRRQRALLRRWARVVPHPVMDYTYSWGHQSSSNPTLRDRPRLQRVFSRRFTSG